jgi:predicted PurR-regulated permease PerM
VQCGNCIAKKSGAADSLTQCLSNKGSLSKKEKIIIIVVCIVVGIIIIAIVVVVVRLKQQAKARAFLVSNLKKQGVNSRIIQNVASLDNSNIDQSIFEQEDVRQALRSASARTANLPKPANVLVAHNANERDGFLGL